MVFEREQSVGRWRGAGIADRLIAVFARSFIPPGGVLGRQNMAAVRTGDRDSSGRRPQKVHRNIRRRKRSFVGCRTASETRKSGKRSVS